MARKINRRNFLKRSSLAAGGAILRACVPKGTPLVVEPSPQPTLTPVITPVSTPEATMPGHEPNHPDLVLTFLHTNDTHGHLAPFRVLEFPEPVGGVARRAACVKQVRAQAEHVLLVDAGDVHQGCLMADAFRGEPDIELMNELGYVAMGLGNHDLDYGWETLLQRRDAAFFPILCANLLYADSGKPLLDTYTIVDEGGIKIAFTSFTGPDWPYIVSPELISGLVIADPLETARQLIPELRAQADLIVVLGHQYIKDADALIGVVPGIDILIGAHEHARLTQAIQIGSTLMVEDYQWGAYLGRLDVAVHRGHVTSYAYGLIPLTADIAADPDIEARVGMLDDEMRRLYPDRFQAIGAAAVDVSDQDIRFREAPLGDLVCDVIRQKAQAEIGILPALTVLNSLFAGPLVVQDIYDALPYPNRLLKVQLRGEQVQQILDIAASGSGTGTFVQVSGLRFRIVGGVATEVVVGGQPLDQKRTYTVAVTDYQAERAIDYHQLFSTALDVQDMGIDIRDILIEHIRTHSPLAVQTDGRIAVEEELQGIELYQDMVYAADCLVPALA